MKDKAKLIRFSEEDLKRIEQDARAAGKTFSEYIRELTLKEPAQHPEVIDVFNKLINEINHIGININQIARMANARGVIDVPHFNKEVDKLDQLIVEIKNKYLRPEKEE